jgi:uncharacterized membrane protein
MSPAVDAAGPSKPVADFGPVAASPPGRQVAIDLARGVAVLLMIQTHAFDGWVAPAHKGSFGYWLSRVVASVPAPLFLLLAGLGLSLGAQAAARRGATAAAIRRTLVGRGLGIAAAGYVVSAIYAAIEGPQPWSQLRAQLFRADILHCIGLSLALCAILLLRRSHLMLRAVGLVSLALVAGLLLPRWLSLPASPWLAALLALLCDVPGYSRFPLLPLVGFCAVGVCVGERLPSLHISRRAAGAAVALAVLVALLAWLATQALLAWLGGPLSRSHPAVIANFVDGTARALATLAFAHWLALRLSPAWLDGLTQLGRASLLAYALHIPLCYGRLATPLSGRLSVAQAAPWVLLLILLCWAAIRLRTALRDALVRRRQPA